MLQRSTPSSRLERWLGRDAVERTSKAMVGWYGPPIAVAGVPGRVYVDGKGDFSGPILNGRFASAKDVAEGHARAFWRKLKRASRETGQLNAGFASLDQVINALTSGQRIDYQFNKVGPTGVVGVTSTLWRLGNQPVAGATPGSAPGGTALTSSTVGAFPFTNPGGSFTQHFLVGEPLATVGPNTLLLYDRLFHVLKTMASTSTEAVTGVPTRYQNTTANAADSIAGNICFVEVGGTALAATGHNWVTCQYTNQAGTTAQNFPSMTGNSGAIVDRLDHPAGSFWMPLASGDTGVKALTQMQCSASVATGVINFVLGHPIAMMPCQTANIDCIRDGINTAVSYARIFDNACLALLEINKAATNATTYNGTFTAGFN